MIPKDQLSQELLYLVPLMTSGATYKAVPTIVFIYFKLLSNSFSKSNQRESPKSIILI